MAATNLKSLHDLIGLCYGTNIIDDLEFILLYNYSQSREFEAQCVTDFVLQKEIFHGRLMRFS